MLGGVVYASLTPAPFDSGIEQGDKLQHFLGYFVVMTWFGQLYHVTWRGLPWLFVAVGIVMEILQGMTGYRSADMADALANAAGVFAAAWLTQGRRGEWLVWLERKFHQPAETR